MSLQLLVWVCLVRHQCCPPVPSKGSGGPGHDHGVGRIRHSASALKLGCATCAVWYKESPRLLPHHNRQHSGVRAKEEILARTHTFVHGALAGGCQRRGGWRTFARRSPEKVYTACGFEASVCCQWEQTIRLSSLPACLSVYQVTISGFNCDRLPLQLFNGDFVLRTAQRRTGALLQKKNKKNTKRT